MEKFEKLGHLIGYMVVVMFVILFWIGFIKLVMWAW